MKTCNGESLTLKIPIVFKSPVELMCRTIVKTYTLYQTITWGVAHGGVQGVHRQSDAVDAVWARALEVGRHTGAGAGAASRAERRERQLPIRVATATRNTLCGCMRARESGRKTAIEPR